MKKVLGAVLIVVVAGSFFAYIQIEPKSSAKGSSAAPKVASVSSNPTLPSAAPQNQSLPSVETEPTPHMTTTDGSEKSSPAVPRATDSESPANCDADAKSKAWDTYKKSWKNENEKFQQLHPLSVPVLGKDKDDHESILNELTYQLDMKLLEAHCL